MSNFDRHIRVVGEIVAALDRLNLSPVLVGGMALAVLGSRRVTQDFDFLIASPAKTEAALLEVFYSRGFELAAKMGPHGEIVSTIDNQKVAAIRLRLDSPSSVYFLNRRSGLRVDLLFDFPLSAKELASRAEKRKISTSHFRIAARADLLRLKELAFADRAFATDAQDLEFLKNDATLKSPRR